MTWIVGMPTMFGYGVGISDIRVTLNDGAEHDCLQKIYPVGQFVALGFAGSVRIGFAMVEVMSRLLHTDDKTQAWDPLAIAEWWPVDAREIFEQCPPQEQAAQCHLMMISTHPTENCGDVPWARSYVHIFRSPDFAAELVPYSKVGAIGCGTAVEPCRQAVEGLSNDYERMTQMMQGEVMNPGGMGGILGFSLTTILKRAQPRGISSHLHYCWVYRGKILIQANDHRTYGRWTSFQSGMGLDQEGRSAPSGKLENDGGVPFTMPQIATSWEELAKLLKGAGASADGCVAPIL